jgi:hypothetical protein
MATHVGINIETAEQLMLDAVLVVNAAHDKVVRIESMLSAAVDADDVEFWTARKVEADEQFQAAAADLHFHSKWYAWLL